MPSTKLNLPRFLPYQLSIASNAVSQLIATEYAARFGLRVQEWRVIAVIGDREALAQRDLVTLTRMDKVSVNRAVRRLVERELLDRVPNPGDGRSHRLALTKAGRALYEDVVPHALDIERQVLKPLSRTEREQLWHLLERLRGSADRLIEKHD
ncbi:MarR family transcriptional regulator [Sphingorhabdus soli]|uniref:MarR family transcriptional regulator n=1 Tax=Flavisphingopyxis soli TaxID=2601267 RepID=A0A5C6U792_9SPHN|nr:MarR family transcriptional regulator [Sphingorhabdus soli]TXC68699.1 MarR family transcriptional regulator [Sphingorhabdus soli]